MQGHTILAPLYELADGDETFFAEVLGSMAENIPLDIDEIEKAIEKGQIDFICRSAHHMKSSIMYSDATELKELLATIEANKQSPAAINEAKASLPKLKELANQLMLVINSEKKG